MAHRILLIEDTQEGQAFVKAALASSGVTIESAQCLKEAREKIRVPTQSKADLIILDLSLPDGDGFDILTDLEQERSAERTPVILLTAKDELEAKLQAFQMGADDYLVKPFHPQELKARVEMRLRKKIGVVEHDVIQKGSLRLDLKQMRAYLDGTKNGTLELTGKELRILSLLLQNEKKVFSRSEIVQAIWEKDVHVLDRTVDSHVCSLRRKLLHYSSFLKSIPGEGYQFYFSENRPSNPSLTNSAPIELT